METFSEQQQKQRGEHSGAQAFSNGHVIAALHRPPQEPHDHGTSLPSPGFCFLMYPVRWVTTHRGAGTVPGTRQVLGNCEPIFSVLSSSIIKSGVLHFNSLMLFSTQQNGCQSDELSNQ